MFETLAMECIRISLLVLGIWPEEHKLEKDFSFLRYRYIVPLLFLVLLIFIPQSAQLFTVYNNLMMITSNLSMANFPVIIGITKFIAVKSHSKVLGEVIRSYAKDWENVKEKEEDAETMLKYANISGKISIGCYVFTQIAGFTLTVKQLHMIINSELNGLDRNFIFPSLFPGIFKVTPYYQLVCLGQLIATYCLTICYSGFDCLVYLLVFHICAQFEILHRALKQAINTSKKLRNPDGFRLAVGIIVRKHEYLNWFAKSMEDSFNICFLVQILFSTFLMCFQCFSIYKAVSKSVDLSMNELLFVTNCMLGNMLFIFIYCYMGELLIVASDGVRSAILESNWYELMPNNMKMLMFIFFRARKPLKLTAGKFSVLSVETYSSVLKTAAGYMSVMMGIESKKEEMI
ncbi:odorant receptor 4-like [Prorops nasuta]|uniref:odorant receptor 4-like n=1 Tax=Prorops nasuta TaxID=863751 RepID=UPI0034CEC100